VAKCVDNAEIFYIFTHILTSYVCNLSKHSDACSFLLKQAGADIDPKLIPGKRDLSTLLTFPKECLGSQFNVPLSDEKQLELRQNRDQFTASEDNLLLRGVVSLVRFFCLF